APAAGGGGEGEVSEEKLWELLEHEGPGRGAAYVLPEEGGPDLKLGPPVEESPGKAPAAPEEEKVFSLDEEGDLASSIKDMAASLGLPMEPPLLVDVEGPAPAPPSSAPVKKPAPMEPVEDLTIPLLESLEILPEEGPAPAPPVPPRPAPPVAAPPAPSAPSHLMNVDQVTREITDNVARAIVQEVSERLAGKIERIVWEVVPDLAEHLITQEIERIKAQAEGPPEKA
ncbi:MAG TPA: hypothetical protein VFV36_11875, partial [Candidatus Methylomirabilis sp.]|nr:hypothetical protein [Candidatus Methylomirabilis sp.]